MFDWILNILHFSLPFSINCISALLLIIISARTRSNAQKKKSFKEHLHEQLKQHKHLLISPLILVMLAIPRLIISYIPLGMYEINARFLALSHWLLCLLYSVNDDICSVCTTVEQLQGTIYQIDEANLVTINQC